MADGVAARSVETSLAAVARDNDRLRAINHLDPADPRRRASSVDDSKSARPLLGLTFVAKDLIDVAGLPSTCGSKLFDATVATEDAHCIRALEASGAVVIGKANMHELAVGGARNPWFGQVINPLSAEHGTGGTSSGSVAAVAAGFCDFALGTDSGGSNRSTAAATGLFGFKPTNGALSVDGIAPLAPSLDTVGLLARDGSVLAKAFAALTGQKPAAAKPTLAGKVFARPIALHGPVDPAVQAALQRAADAIRSAGGKIVDIDFGDAAGLAQAGRDILRHEFSCHYRQVIASRSDRVGKDVQAFLAAAAEVSAAQYEDAIATVEDHRGRWHEQLLTVDAMLSPATPGLAPRLSDEHTKVGDRWVPYGASGAEFRMWANTIGIPAVAVPVARSGGLPASVQIAARRNADGLLIDLSAALGREIQKQRAATDREAI
ncbi:amidase [Dongia sedimenti]|uniref:Amidase n=1 Tax=Dongia sedimenti TaxID=3064282 RepID=A0ABU0YVC5_9PROT|nr:amidase [Rhodospirillaceae bacterium R-7]